MQGKVVWPICWLNSKFCLAKQFYLLEQLALPKKDVEGLLFPSSNDFSLLNFLQFIALYALLAFKPSDQASLSLSLSLMHIALGFRRRKEENMMGYPDDNNFIQGYTLDLKQGRS